MMQSPVAWCKRWGPAVAELSGDLLSSPDPSCPCPSPVSVGTERIAECTCHDHATEKMIQKNAIERTGSRTAVELAQELKGHILDLAVCPHGNYVVQKVVSHLSVAASHFVLEELRGHAARTAKHRFACRILCRLLEFCGSASAELVEELLQEICRCPTGR
ncbi:mRNA-binding protein puf3 (Pumilio homology domain family member 3) [Durusdinium trenchii]|uniref:mRNA-binding protein puf3 (Pumilio homology domain family member 3) n=1 Tax=Durusdinium trenchii TaxID=1381693 RepID=A0ABP0SD62_9DINO